MKIKLLFILMIVLTCFSCQDSQKEVQLNEREYQLSIKEKEFTTKEADYKSLLLMRDSLKQAVDTAIVEIIPANLIGKWNGKMVCTDSNCSDYVINDQRNDIWDFTEGKVKIINKNGMTKNYLVKNLGTELKLTPEEESNNSSTTTLKIPTGVSTRIKGVREFTGSNGCNAKFSVELEKITSQ